MGALRKIWFIFGEPPKFQLTSLWQMLSVLEGSLPMWIVYDSLKKISSGNLFEPKDFEGISFHSGG